jgi:hypothetical protein
MERAGERRRAFLIPLSSILSPLLRRGERKEKWRASKIFAGLFDVMG